jgi:hypothetical protein
MNETVMQNPAFAEERKESTRLPFLRGWGTEFSAYVLLALMIVLGWLIRDRGLITPKDGTGYWLGIVGGTLMLFLLLYPLRKRIKMLHQLGSTKQWFQTHIILGLVGPLLVLYHSSFQLGSFNSRVALYCMLVVAGSGIIGRHFYARIHSGLDGHRSSLGELQKELALSVEKSHGLAKLMPNLAGRLEEMSAQLRGHEITRSIGIGRCLRWTFTHHLSRLSLLLTARRELRAAAANSQIIAADKDRLWRSVSKYIRDYTGLVGRLSQFSFYERLFSIWHVFHLPTFFIMVLAALFHVLAVHMY